jgi:SAM-dependent methyltransferase
MTTTQPEQADFDRVARVYRWAEYISLGTLLQRTREHFLPELADRRRALVLGDGDGRFLARLLQHNTALQALAVDTSAAMLSLLQHRCTFAADRLQTRCGSALDEDLPKNTDLIVTHFFLDCLTQPEVQALTQRLGHAAQTGTLWLLSDAAIYVRSLYLAFALLTGLRVKHLPDPQRALAAEGFEQLARHQRLGGLLYTELWRRR